MIFYVLLGAVLAAAVTGVVLIALQPGPPKPAPWSSWRPASGSAQTVAKEVADHVGRTYRLNSAGDQLVAIVPGKPEVTHNTNISSVSTIAIRASASSNNFSRIISTKGAIQEQFCGLGSSCSIAHGSASSARERLLRREALEIALYTFKYSPTVDAVIVYMPPPPGQSPATLLYLERSNLASELDQPLNKTLPLATPPLPSQPDHKESATIDKLTLPVQYGFQYETLSNGTAAMILTPSY
jgi:hypothetical protein